MFPCFVVVSFPTGNQYYSGLGVVSWVPAVVHDCCWPGWDESAGGVAGGVAPAGGGGAAMGGSALAVRPPQQAVRGGGGGRSLSAGGAGRGTGPDLLRPLLRPAPPPAGRLSAAGR